VDVEHAGAVIHESALSRDVERGTGDAMQGTQGARSETVAQPLSERARPEPSESFEVAS
jgi:hypothetical protein